jgi:hypothetical protein
MVSCVNEQILRGAADAYGLDVVIFRIGQLAGSLEQVRASLVFSKRLLSHQSVELLARTGHPPLSNRDWPWACYPTSKPLQRGFL